MWPNSSLNSGIADELFSDLFEVPYIGHLGKLDYLVLATSYLLLKGVHMMEDDGYSNKKK